MADIYAQLMTRFAYYLMEIYKICGKWSDVRLELSQRIKLISAEKKND